VTGVGRSDFRIFRVWTADHVSTFGRLDLLFRELVNFGSSFRVLLEGLFSNHTLKYGLVSTFR
jgi:hypothetical protein